MRTRPSISVLIPTSLTSDTEDHLQKTLKVGAVGRTLAIFRVEKVCVYDDSDPHVKNQEKERLLISTLLEYMETPQYLRKLLFPRMAELLHAGALPPLRTPHHPLPIEKISVGALREGVVVEVSGNESLLEVGLRKKVRVPAILPIRTRQTAIITGENRKHLLGKLVSRDEIQDYWGYRVLQAKSLKEGLKLVGADLRLGTSRLGNDLKPVIEMMGKNVNSIAVAFGGPYAGLYEICGRQGINPEKTFDKMVNTVPGQGTSTVRTEEALLATLALLNYLLRG